MSQSCELRTDLLDVSQTAVAGALVEAELKRHIAGREQRQLLWLARRSDWACVT